MADADPDALFEADAGRPAEPRRDGRGRRGRARRAAKRKRSSGGFAGSGSPARPRHRGVTGPAAGQVVIQVFATPDRDKADGWSPSRSAPTSRPSSRPRARGRTMYGVRVGRLGSGPAGGRCARPAGPRQLDPSGAPSSRAQRRGHPAAAGARAARALRLRWRREPGRPAWPAERWLVDRAGAAAWLLRPPRARSWPSSTVRSPGSSPSWIAPHAGHLRRYPAAARRGLLSLLAAYLGAYHAAFAWLGRVATRRGLVLAGLPALWCRSRWLRTYLGDSASPGTSPPTRGSRCRARSDRPPGSAPTASPSWCLANVGGLACAVRAGAGSRRAGRLAALPSGLASAGVRWAGAEAGGGTSVAVRARATEHSPRSPTSPIARSAARNYQKVIDAS